MNADEVAIMLDELATASLDSATKSAAYAHAADIVRTYLSATPRPRKPRGDIRMTVPPPVRVADESGPSGERLLSVPEAAAALRLAQSTVWAMIKDGDLSTVKIRKRRLVHASSVASFLRSAGAS